MLLCRDLYDPGAVMQKTAGPVLHYGSLSLIYRFLAKLIS